MSKLRKIKSFDVFSEELQEQNPGLVVIQADRRLPRDLLSFTSTATAVGRLGMYQHGLLYSASTGKRQRQYIEPIFEAFQSEYGLTDQLERNKRIMQVLLAGEVRVELLKTVLPEADVYLAGSNPLEPMSEQELKQLHRDAEKNGVRTPTLAV